MAQQFIKISTHKQAGNKLQQLVIDSILQLDQSLHADLDAAKDRVYGLFRDALLSYEGKCTMDFPRGSQTTPFTWCVYIGEHLIVAIHEVKTDFS
jgi:hypothetical protein